MSEEDKIVRVYKSTPLTVDAPPILGWVYDINGNPILRMQVDRPPLYPIWRVVEVDGKLTLVEITVSGDVTGTTGGVYSKEEE